MKAAEGFCTKSHRGSLSFLSTVSFHVIKQPAGKMAAKLEAYSFSEIVINRKVYDDRGEKLLTELAAAGWPMEFEQGIDNEWFFIRLTPDKNPTLPTLAPYALTQEKEEIRLDRVHYWAPNADL